MCPHHHDAERATGYHVLAGHVLVGRDQGIEAAGNRIQQVTIIEVGEPREASGLNVVARNIVS